MVMQDLTLYIHILINKEYIFYIQIKYGYARPDPKFNLFHFHVNYLLILLLKDWGGLYFSTEALLLIHANEEHPMTL